MSVRRGRHPAGEVADGLGGDLGDGGGPLGGFGDAVGVAEEVGLEGVVAGGVAGEEGGVVEAFGDEGVGEGEHDRDVGAGAERVPAGVEVVGEVVADGGEEFDGGAAGGEGAEVVADGVAGGAARGDIGVFDGHAAEGDDQLGVLGDDGPGGGVGEHVAHAAGDAVEDDLACGVGVGVAGVDVAAEGVEEAVELALGVVEAAGAGPAVGAAEDGFGAVVSVDAVEFGGEELGGGLPIDGDEGVGAAVVRRAGAVVEPAFADHGLLDAGGAADGAGDVVEDGGGVGIAGVGAGFDEGAVLDDGVEGAPVGASGG